MISHYHVAYRRGQAINVTEKMVLLDGLRSAMDYAISLAAVSDDGGIGPAYNITVHTLPPGIHSTSAKQQ